MEYPTAEPLKYETLIKEAGNCSAENLISFLSEELRYLWRDAYLQMMPRATEIVRMQRGPFEYIFDDYATLETTGAVPYSPDAEARLVAVLGRSEPKIEKRDDGRLRGWVGPTEKMFGCEWDKGHFIAHSIGGAADRWELNVFVQRRELNRGWSEAGKRFREMEEYCGLNPATFCFSRPLYVDQTAKPAFIEFGLLKKDGKLWVECFDNR